MIAMISRTKPTTESAAPLWRRCCLQGTSTMESIFTKLHQCYYSSWRVCCLGSSSARSMCLFYDGI
ncbi:hypothetical protein JG687_00010353 [Phytophthora cactorum]|uniref:Uncharacterized protein n=1 Tax=Phytophthora cactorum TaxID=29920 RepID=A0A8T1U8P2_9STRA|nr:hypothetical protein JG687_00010353 [Phytophthora cactorum]